MAGSVGLMNGYIATAFEITPITREVEETLARHQCGAASNHLISPVGHSCWKMGI